MNPAAAPQEGFDLSHIGSTATLTMLEGQCARFFADWKREHPAEWEQEHVASGGGKGGGGGAGTGAGAATGSKPKLQLLMPQRPPPVPLQPQAQTQAQAQTQTGTGPLPLQLSQLGGSTAQLGGSTLLHVSSALQPVSSALQLGSSTLQPVPFMPSHMTPLQSLQAVQGAGSTHSTGLGMQQRQPHVPATQPHVQQQPGGGVAPRVARTVGQLGQLTGGGSSGRCVKIILCKLVCGFASDAWALFRACACGRACFVLCTHARTHAKTHVYGGGCSVCIEHHHMPLPYERMIHPPTGISECTTLWSCSNPTFPFLLMLGSCRTKTCCLLPVHLINPPMPPLMPPSLDVPCSFSTIPPSPEVPCSPHLMFHTFPCTALCSTKQGANPHPKRMAHPVARFSPGSWQQIFDEMV